MLGSLVLQELELLLHVTEIVEAAMWDLTLHFVYLQTSDEAVSDLSSLSDESTNERHSFEDQIAQAVVSKVCFLSLLDTPKKKQKLTGISNKLSL